MKCYFLDLDTQLKNHSCTGNHVLIGNSVKTCIKIHFYYDVQVTSKRLDFPNMPWPLYRDYWYANSKYMYL